MDVLLCDDAFIEVLRFMTRIQLIRLAETCARWAHIIAARFANAPFVRWHYYSYVYHGQPELLDVIAAFLSDERRLRDRGSCDFSVSRYPNGEARLEVHFEKSARETLRNHSNVTKPLATFGAEQVLNIPHFVRFQTMQIFHSVQPGSADKFVQQVVDVTKRTCYMFSELSQLQFILRADYLIQLAHCAEFQDIFSNHHLKFHCIEQCDKTNLKLRPDEFWPRHSILLRFSNCTRVKLTVQLPPDVSDMVDFLLSSSNRCVRFELLLDLSSEFWFMFEEFSGQLVHLLSEKFPTLRSHVCVYKPSMSMILSHARARDSTRPMSELLTYLNYITGEQIRLDVRNAQICRISPIGNNDLML